MKCLVSFRELDSLGEGLVRDYAKRTHSWNAICLDIEGFVTDYLGLKIVYETIREEDRSVLGFLADGTSSLSVSRNGDEVGVIFPKGTVVIEKYLNLEGESSRKRFTLAHEAGHAILARHVPLQTGGCFQNAFDEAVSYGREELLRMFSVNEACANRLGAALLMPEYRVERALRKYNDGMSIQLSRCFICFLL